MFTSECERDAQTVVNNQPMAGGDGRVLRQRKGQHLNGSLKSNGHLKNGIVLNGNCNKDTKGGENDKIMKTPSDNGKTTIKTSGWLNLMANIIDNFTHGLAVAGSYCISTKSGFDRWKAAKAQLLTASGGLLGAVAALSSESAEIAGNRTAWILPFTSGGFIYIALVTVVPDLLKETNRWESLKQLLCLLCGIIMVSGVTLLCE
ncbi:hypothetical protein LSH36_514g01000 [Paralvinella palmiformis]|uniref:Uncharacterized protein n=1 Tax=Paralvinella palmiformis TaxID=53620 RepID=A0AAD9MWK2_9ANNE|nr:hypothetical protein LSH36_514g01000 [Paralvinella palmiformis]